MKYYKVINTTTKQEFYAKAVSMDHVLLYIINNMTVDWFYGVNIVEVNEDKSRNGKTDFTCMAIRRAFVDDFGVDDDAVILDMERRALIKRIKERRAA